jgi:hypothetical protein
MILLALAYALIEEAFLTQSLFNPNYVNQRLLDYGYVPALGTSFNWTFFVLTIHVVWSVATPILIAEGLAGARRTVPWLGEVGLAVIVVLYLLGCASTAVFSMKSSPFVASKGQFLVSAVLVVTVVTLAFRLFDRLDVRRAATETAAPPRVFVTAATVVLASAYMASEGFARAHGVAPAGPMTFRLACEAVAVALYSTWPRHRGWTAQHYLAIAAGTSFTYFVFGLNVLLSGHTNLGVSTDAVEIAGHVALGAAVLGLILLGARRSSPTLRDGAMPTATADSA